MGLRHPSPCCESEPGLRKLPQSHLSPPQPGIRAWTQLLPSGRDSPGRALEPRAGSLRAASPLWGHPLSLSLSFSLGYLDPSFHLQRPRVGSRG